MLQNSRTANRRQRGRRPGPKVAGAAVAVALALGVGTDSGRVVARQAAAGTGDPIAELVGRLDLDRYKAVIRGLAQFGDRRQGTQRNRDAVDWIEAWLESAGCPTERLHYTYDPPPRTGRATPPRPEPPLNTPGPTATGGRIGRNGSGPGGSSIFGYRARTGVARDPLVAARREAPRAEPRGADARSPFAGLLHQGGQHARPDEMYILGAHMDGLGFGEAADDDASGTALVMELARILNAPDVETEVSHTLRALERRGDRASTAVAPTWSSGRARQGVEDPSGLRPLSPSRAGWG